MLHLIRKHVPAARSISDGRLTALLVAGVVLLTTVGNFAMSRVAMIGIGIAVWYYVRKRHAEPTIRLAPASAFEEYETEPRTVRVKEAVVRTSSQDPLVARAEALLRRVETRA